MKKKDTKKVIENKVEKTEIQKLQEQQERESLLFGADALLSEKPDHIRQEQFELANGFVGTMDELRAMLRKKPRNINPMFPYKIPFFKLIFKLMGWHNKDYRKFIKPWVVGRIIRRFIYRRFPENVLPNLLDLPNPALFHYIRKYKLYQFLTDDGLIMLEGFIADAIEVMKVATDWKDFEDKYCALYNLEVPARQAKLFEDEG